ncbi:MAG: 30S ribosome-binding factor RbfA [Acidobacteriota bacterium]
MDHRRQRFEEQIQREVSRILVERLNDPRLGFLSVTSVRASSDLKHACVHVSVHGNLREVCHTVDLLQKARSFVRRELGQSLRLRYVPELEFREDMELQRTARVEEILESLKRGELDS